MSSIPRNSIINLEPLLNTKIRVKLIGNRELSGILKSYDRIPNIVLDDTEEHGSESRSLGIAIVRGPMIVSLMPDDLTEISSPF